MLQAAHYNQFSEPDNLPVLKPGETATFKLLKVGRDPADHSKIAIPYAWFVRPVQRVKDPANGKWVVMANIESINLDGTPVIKHPAFTHNMGGYKTLSGDNPVEADEYTFMMLSNNNGSNKDRVVSEEIIFETVDKKLNADKNRSDRRVKYEAMHKSRTMKDEEQVRKFAAAMNWDHEEDIAVLRDKIESYAEDCPEDFLARLNDSLIEIKSNIRFALDEKIILIDAIAGKFAWGANKETIFKYPARIEAGSEVEILAEYFNTDQRGKLSYDLMVKRLTGKRSLEKEEEKKA